MCLSIYIPIHTCICVYVCVYIYIYIFIGLVEHCLYASSVWLCLELQCSQAPIIFKLPAIHLQASQVMGYSQFSSILIGCSILNHPFFWVTPHFIKPPFELRIGYPIPSTSSFLQLFDEHMGGMPASSVVSICFNLRHVKPNKDVLRNFDG